MTVKELTELRADRDAWKAHCEVACDKVKEYREQNEMFADVIVTQKEQIQRLRESLIAVIAESDRATVAYNKAKAVLKETAP